MSAAYDAGAEAARDYARGFEDTVGPLLEAIASTERISVGLKKAAKLVGLGEQVIRDAIASGDLPCFHGRVPIMSLNAWLVRHAEAEAATRRPNLKPVERKVEGERTRLEPVRRRA